MDKQYLIDLLDGRIEYLQNEVERARAVREELVNGAGVAVHTSHAGPASVGKIADMIQRRDRAKSAQQETPASNPVEKQEAPEPAKEPAPKKTSKRPPADEVVDGRRLMSKTAYQKYQGWKGQNQLYKLIKGGRIAPEPDGRIDVARADAVIGPPGTQRPRGKGAKSEKKKKAETYPGGLDPKAVERWRADNPDDPDLAFLEDED